MSLIPYDPQHAHAKCLWPEDCKFPACICRRTADAPTALKGTIGHVRVGLPKARKA